MVFLCFHFVFKLSFFFYEDLILMQIPLREFGKCNLFSFISLSNLI